jgi:hypothetical protein
VTVSGAPPALTRSGPVPLLCAEQGIGECHCSGTGAPVSRMAGAVPLLFRGTVTETFYFGTGRRCSSVVSRNRGPGVRWPGRPQTTLEHE